MIPGMNPKMLAQAMKKMGIKQEEIPATEVIIRTPEGKDLIIRNPQVSKVNAMGQESLQIIGDIEEMSQEASDEDVDTVVSQTGVSKEKAKNALKQHNNDLAATILALKED